MEKILLLLTILSISVFTQASLTDSNLRACLTSSYLKVSAFPVFSGTGDTFYDKQGDSYTPEGTYFYPGEKGEMIEKRCSDATYVSDPSIMPDLDTYPIGSFPGKDCNLRRDRDGAIFPMFHNPINEKVFCDYHEVNAPSSNLEEMAFCDYHEVYAPPSNYGPPIAVGSHLGSAWFKLSVNWYKSDPTSNGIRYYTTSNRWVTEYWPNGITIYTGNVTASIYTFFKSYGLVLIEGRLAVC